MYRPDKILVIRFSSIGDIVLTGPLLAALDQKMPDAQVDYLTKARFADLVRYNPSINEILTLDQHETAAGLSKVVSEVRSRRYDLVIDLHSSLRSHAVSALSGARIIRPDIRHFTRRFALVYLGLNLFNQVEPIAGRYFNGLDACGLNWNGSGLSEAPWLHVPEEALGRVKTLLSEDSSRPILAVAPAAKWNTKTWPAEKFAAVIRKLKENNSNYHVILLGSKEDFDVCERLKSLLDRNATNFAGRLSLMESAAAISISKAMICNDSGLMHIAEALGVPMVTIFGCTTKELGYFPLSKNSEVVEVPLRCRPCTKNGRQRCPLGHFECMNNISVDMVYQAASKLLDVKV